MARRIGWICLAFSLVSFFADSTEAQIFHRAERVVQAPWRYFGHGNGPGYHYYNRGPDTSYYNPWSQKNSFLISQSPQFLARYGNEVHRSPMEILQMGSVDWGHQQRYGQPSPALQQYGPAAPMRADFVPSTRADDVDDNEGDDEDASGGDFDADSSDQQIEDRFEEDADSMDDLDKAGQSGDDLDEAIGGFGSLKEAVGSSRIEPGSLLTPSGVFQPASHSGR